MKHASPYTPDFVALAESYGAHGIRVEREEDIQAALDKARTYKDAPTVIEFQISSDEIVLDGKGRKSDERDDLK